MEDHGILSKDSGLRKVEELERVICNMWTSIRGQFKHSVEDNSEDSEYGQEI